MKAVSSQKVYKEAIEYGPVLVDGVLTFLTFALLGGIMWLLYQDGDFKTLRELIAFLLGAAFAIGNFKYFFMKLHTYIASEKALQKPRNNRKYGDQGWQLAIHIFATAYEIHLIADYSNWGWWTNIGTIFNPLSENQRFVLQRFYMCQVGLHYPGLLNIFLKLFSGALQLGIWFATAISHKVPCTGVC